MFFKASAAAGFIAAVNALPQVSQISDGQLQVGTPAPKATLISQISDGQLQVPGTPATTAASATSSPFGPYDYPQMPSVNSAYVSSVASYAGLPATAIPGLTNAVPPRVSSQVTGVTSHGPYSGTPTTVGAVTTIALATAILPSPPLATATTYNPNGLLHAPMPVPYQPAGGLGTGGNEPVYRVQSDFDYESILLGLYQEWIELDLFHYILATFSEEEFTAAGLTASDRFLIEFMADQETGHATLLSNLLGGPGGATPQCTYNYPFKTVHEAFDFTQKLTRFGESGVWGFQSHLDSREVAQLLDQSIATEARQQQIFRQFSGLFPMPVWFETGIPQSWAWTLLAPYISSCPANTKRLAWQNFPGLKVLNQPNSARWNATQTGFNETTGFGPTVPSTDPPAAESCLFRNETGFSCKAAISQNRTIPLSYPGREVFLEWENAGKAVGPNNSYITTTTAKEAKFVLWVSQLNITYSPITNITQRNGLNYGQTIQPAVSTYEGDPAINGTMFIAITENDAPYTAFNLSLVNPHVFAGPFLYQAG